MKKHYRQIDLITFQKKSRTEEQREKRLFKLRWPT